MAMWSPLDQSEWINCLLQGEASDSDEDAEAAAVGGGGDDTEEDVDDEMLCVSSPEAYTTASPPRLVIHNAFIIGRFTNFLRVLGDD